MASKGESADQLGTFEAQTMVRRMKTYTIVEPELRNLWATTLAANILLLFASMSAGFAVSCLTSSATVPDWTKLSEQQQALFYYGPRIGFGTASVLLLMTVGAWILGYWTIRDIRKTSREGRVLAG